MYYARAVNCCAEVRAILDAAPFCIAAPAACAGDCGTLTSLFADAPMPPAFPNGLSEYTCTAFPDDSVPTDSLIVALISIAVGLPVVIFVGSALEVANKSEAPDSLLDFHGVPRLLLGPVHRRWHWTGPRGPPARLVRWYCRCASTPLVETLRNLWLAVKAFVTRTQPPWLVAAAEAMTHGTEHDHQAEAAELVAKKRVYTAFGLGSVAVCWAAFSWCARAAWRVGSWLALTLRLFLLRRFIFTYGMLIYRLAGAQEEAAFARSWGVSYGMNAATEWRDVLKEALNGALVLVVLETLYLTRNVHWLEEHIDLLSLQALLFGRATRWGRCAARASSSSTSAASRTDESQLRGAVPCPPRCAVVPPRRAHRCTLTVCSCAEAFWHRHARRVL